MTCCSYDDIVERIAALAEPSLIAIDGLPVSGKSTLADALERDLKVDCIYLDDFVLPEAEWPSPLQPAFPFPYIRYEDFCTAIQKLRDTGACSFRPFDWSTGTTTEVERRVCLDRHVLIEGVSTLSPQLNPFYGLRIFVDSDRETTLAAALERGVGSWAEAWRDVFLPSVDTCMRSNPQVRADLIYAGRGIAG